MRVSEVGPIATGAWRFGIAALILAAIFRVRGVSLALPLARGSRDMAFLVFGGVFLGFSVSLWQASIMATSIANASILGNIHPFVAAIGGWLWFRERVTLPYLVGAAVALAGIALLVRASAGPMTAVSAGDAIAIASGAALAGWILILKRLRRSFATPQATVYPLAIASPTMFAIALFAGEDMIAATGDGWLLLLGFALVVNVIGQSAFVYASGQLRASVISLAMVFVPVVASAFGWLFLGEPVTLLQGAAGLTMLGGIAIAQWRPPRRTTVR